MKTKIKWYFGCVWKSEEIVNELSVLTMAGTITIENEFYFCPTIERLNRMKIKENAKQFSTQDFFYDLFSGGYIKPADFLEMKDAERVLEAMKTIREFEEMLEESGLMEYN
jgi:hypothetical protein